MRRIIVALLSIAFIHSNLARTVDHLTKLPSDVWGYIFVTIDARSIVNFFRANKELQLFFDHDWLWQLLYVSKLDQKIKLRPELSYKENFFQYRNRVAICGIDCGSKHNLQDFQKRADSKARYCELDEQGLLVCMTLNTGAGFMLERVVDKNSPKIWTGSKIADALNNSLVKRPKIVYIFPISLVEIDHENYVWFSKKLCEALLCARDKDVLIIAHAIYVHNVAIDPHESVCFNERQMHSGFPNIIWVNGYYKTKKLHRRKFSEHGTVGSIFHIAAPCWIDHNSHVKPNGDSHIDILYLAEAAILMRGLRPDLSASQIGTILKETADHTLESIKKIPNGGFLNLENALKRITKIDHKGEHNRN